MGVWEHQHISAGRSASHFLTDHVLILCPGHLVLILLSLHFPMPVKLPKNPFLQANATLPMVDVAQPGPWLRITSPLTFAVQAKWWSSTKPHMCRATASKQHSLLCSPLPNHRWMGGGLWLCVQSFVSWKRKHLFSSWWDKQKRKEKKK